MKLLFRLLFGLAVFAPRLAAADPVVIELFANQNCGACPEAHATMETLIETRDDVMVLTWAVDYWDYLGDPDPMSLPEAKARQAAYADRFHLRGPYTPQAVFNGVEQVQGNKIRKVKTCVRNRQKADEGKLAFARAEDGGWSLRGGSAGEYDVFLLHIADDIEDAVVNPVSSAEKLVPGPDGALPVSCAARCALIAQEPHYGAIRAAAWVAGR